MTKKVLIDEANDLKQKIKAYYYEASLQENSCDYLIGQVHLKAYIHELINHQEISITDEVLKRCHALLMEVKADKCEGTMVGQYRTGDLRLSWGQYVPPSAEELDHLMKHFMGQMEISIQMFHPIEFAAICHKRILEICPFQEGNEELAMLIMNLVLMRNGFEAITSFENEEAEYRSTLIAAQHPSSPKLDEFINFIAKCVVKAERRKCEALHLI